MNDKMEQEASGGAIAIQSQRDTNIGFTPEQVMDAIAEKLPAFGVIAREIVEARVADFKKEILERIAANEARMDAFADPAFVNTLNTGEKGFAFTDEPETREVLLDLIAKRSMEEKRTRKSLTLDQAVEVASSLTKSEFSELSLLFIFRYTANNVVNNRETFAAYLNRHMAPFIDDVSRDESAYSYLEAQRCGTISLAGNDFKAVLSANYSGVLSKGLERGQLDTVAGSAIENNPHYVVACLHDQSKVQFNAMNKVVFEDRFKDFSVERRDALWSTFESSLMSKEEIVAAYSPFVPKIDLFASLWDETPLHRFQLTTIGMALGYMNAVRAINFDADLSIWIK